MDVTKSPESFVVREEFVPIREHAVRPESSGVEVVFKVSCCYYEGGRQNNDLYQVGLLLLLKGIRKK